MVVSLWRNQLRRLSWFLVLNEYPIYHTHRRDKCWIHPSAKGVCSLLFLFVPTLALAKSHQILINQSNLINTRDFEDEAFRTKMKQLSEIYCESIDIWIMTYAKCVALLDLLQQSSELGYVKEFFFDESQCFVQEYLTFHDDLKFLHLQLLKVPIHLLSGSLTIEEQRILMKMIGMNRPSTAMHHWIVSGEYNDAAFKTFNSRSSIHRDHDDTRLPEGLVHYQVQHSKYDYYPHKSTQNFHENAALTLHIPYRIPSINSNTSMK